MRYIKTLLLACLFFVLLIFFFQNQTVLAQELQLTLNLFFTAAMTSIKLPFYFLIIAAFLLGAVLSLSLLVWDKINLTAKLMKNNWYIKALENEVEKLQKQVGATPAPGFFDKLRGIPDVVKGSKKESAEGNDINKIASAEKNVSAN